MVILYVQDSIVYVQDSILYVQGNQISIWYVQDNILCAQLLYVQTKVAELISCMYNILYST